MRLSFTGFLGPIALLLTVMGSRAEEAPTIFVLDATAQMNAKLGQQRKIDLVKSAIGAISWRLAPATPLGLWAFGTSPQKKCEDAAELVPLQPTPESAAAIEKALASVQPKAARTPVFDTVQAALKSRVGVKDKPVSVVVVAGAGDDCIGDICKAAEGLHAEYPNAKLTVFGVGMSEQPAANLSCAAKAMGGGFTAVKTAGELDKAMRLALNITQNAASTRSAAVPNAQGNSVDLKDQAASSPSSSNSVPTPRGEDKISAPAQPLQAEPNTILSAVLAPGMAPLDAGVTWEIYKVTLTPTGQLRAAETPAWTGGGGQAKLKLAEGRYVAHGGFGLAAGSAEFTVSGEKAESTISLNTGTIAAEAFQTKDAQAVDGVLFVLQRRKSAALEELGRSSEVPAIFHVNAGDYVLSAVTGPVKVDALVKVEAGKVSSVRVPLNIGTLELKTAETEGSTKPIAVWHRIYPATTGPGMSASPLLRIAGSYHRVQLPAGSYRLQTSYGNAVEESIISIAAGQVTSQSVVLDAGEAKLSLASGKADRICAVYPVGADRKPDPIGRGAGAEMSFILKAGLYDFECKGKGSTGPAKLTQIRVVAGEVQSTKIED